MIKARFESGLAARIEMENVKYRNEIDTITAAKRRSRIDSVTLRTCILALLAFAMAAFLLYDFGMIWLFGRFYVYEPNQIILVLETITTIAVLVFSGFCWTEQMRRIR